MAELVDARVSGTRAARCRSSSLLSGTNNLPCDMHVNELSYISRVDSVQSDFFPYNTQVGTFSWEGAFFML